MERTKKTQKRPVIIWVLSILMLVGFVFSIPLAVIGQSLYGILYARFLIASSVIGLLSFVGIFFMKKWGLQLYVWMFFVGQAIMIVKQWWTPLSFILPFIYIIIISLYYKRMN